MWDDFTTPGYKFLKSVAQGKNNIVPQETHWNVCGQASYLSAADIS